MVRRLFCRAYMHSIERLLTTEDTEYAEGTARCYRAKYNILQCDKVAPVTLCALCVLCGFISSFILGRSGNMQVFLNQEVILEDVLAAREKRAGLQAEMRAAHHASIVSLSINMPGSIKYTEDVVSLLYTALGKLRQRFFALGFSLLEERIYHVIAGPGAVLAVGGEAAQIKRAAVELEEEASYARLLDIDVFMPEGKQLSRTDIGLPLRTCLVCQGEAVLCMREQKHDRNEVVSAAYRLLASYKAQEIQELLPREVEIIGIAALEAMLMELACTPAPGLVDRFNPGAHRDMDFFTFTKSSSVLSIAMHRCALAGWRHKGESGELLPLLRTLGCQAEQAMFQATAGINTQKGILFLMGIMVAAAAQAARKGKPVTAQQVTDAAARICQGIVARELEAIRKLPPQRKLTAGERFYVEHGVTGIRGEIEAGLPSVQKVGLPCLREGLAQGLHLNDALVHALLGLMSVTQDTTILNRHNMDVLDEVKAEAKALMAEGGMLSSDAIQKVTEMDNRFISRNISPGGSADLLAVTYFLHLLEERL